MTNKIASLDSLRGIAAIVVMFGHFAAFFPAIVTGTGSQNGISSVIYKSPLSILFAGGFAVILFFILSGFVLTLKFFSNQENSLFPAAVKRYIRLMPVAFVSVMLGYVLMASGAMGFGALNQSAHIGTLVYPFNFQPDFSSALIQGVVGIFAYESNGASAYNPVLWTIYYELLGAFIVFGLASLVRGHAKRWLLYVIAFIAFINTFFCAFIVGVVLADLYVNRSWFFMKFSQLNIAYKTSLLLLALSIGGFQSAASSIDRGVFWNMITLLPNNQVLSARIMQLIAGSLLIILALSWNGFSRALNHRVLLWLGKISYTLYAVHFILIYSLTSMLISALLHELSYMVAAAIAIAISLVVIVVLAWVLHIYVEVPSIRAASRVGKWVKE